MKQLTLFAAFALSGCAAGGGFVAPSAMTDQERCDNAVTAAIFLDGAYGPDSLTASSAAAQSGVICKGGGVVPSIPLGAG